MSYEAWGDGEDPPELPEGCWDEDAVLEAQECIDRAAVFLEDVIPQIGELCIQDYDNLNQLGILLEKLKSRKTTPNNAN